jgi:pyruvate formate lyase activating enzyme
MINPARSGICRVRTNEAGKLYTHIYGEVAALALDPLEKKPLYHFYPGRQILSVGTWGCNFSCAFCQNYRLAHEQAETRVILPEQLAELAVRARDQDWWASLLPIMNLQYGSKCTGYGPALKFRGLKTVLVTNGFIDPEPLMNCFPLLMQPNRYQSFQQIFISATARRLQEVKDNIAFMAGKIHVELRTCSFREKMMIPVKRRPWPPDQQP